MILRVLFAMARGCDDMTRMLREECGGCPKNREETSHKTEGGIVTAQQQPHLKGMQTKKSTTFLILWTAQTFVGCSQSDGI
jgi:hypothetical protein